MSKTITICNQKGGVGKTTTAINLSTSLALAEQKILLIDIDPQGNATSGIGIDKSSITKSIYHSILEQAPIKDIIIPTQVKNLDLIPSNISLTGAEVELVGLLSREQRLKRALTSITGSYDMIIIDCPPSLGLLTINALTASDSVLIPIQCEYYALEGLGQLMNTVNLVRDNLNPDLEIEGILLTMADYRTNLSREVIKEVKNYFSELDNASPDNKNKVYQAVIPRSIKITESPGFGKPIALYDSNSHGAQKYDELAREILTQYTQPTTETNVDESAEVAPLDNIDSQITS